MNYIIPNFDCITEETYKDLIMSGYDFNQFAFNVDMLNYRLSEYFRLDFTNPDKENHQHCLMIADSTLVMIRAMLLDNWQNSYSITSFYKRVGREDILQELNTFLDSEFVCGQSIRTRLKFLIDKFICHVDKIESWEIGLGTATMAQLSNPYAPVNMKHIVTKVAEIVAKA